eukprot:144132-Rhodomonas_salina.1
MVRAGISRVAKEKQNVARFAALLNLRKQQLSTMTRAAVSNAIGYPGAWARVVALHVRVFVVKYLCEEGLMLTLSCLLSPPPHPTPCASSRTRPRGRVQSESGEERGRWRGQRARGTHSAAEVDVLPHLDAALIAGKCLSDACVRQGSAQSHRADRTDPRKADPALGRGRAGQEVRPEPRWTGLRRVEDHAHSLGEPPGPPPASGFGGVDVRGAMQSGRC